MVDILRSLHTVSTATIRERDGSYGVEAPKRGVEHEAVSPGEVCRVALVGRTSAEAPIPLPSPIRRWRRARSAR